MSTPESPDVEPVLPEEEEDEEEAEVGDWSSAWEQDQLSAVEAWFSSSTGILDAGALEPLEGQVTSSHDGEVIENLDITWSTEGQPRPNSDAALLIQHDDVLVRNVRIRAEGPSRGIQFDPGTEGGRVEACEIDGAMAEYGTDRSDANYGNDGIIVQGGPVDIERCRIYGVRVGLQAVPGSVITENWITDLHQNAPGTSTSSIQRHPPPESPTASEDVSVVQRNLVEAGSSGGITMYAENQPIQGSIVRDNLIVGVGRGFGIRGGRSHVQKDLYLDNRDIRIEGNRFAGTFGFPDELGRGSNAGVDLQRPGNTFVDNRWIDETAELPARCGVESDECD